MLSLVPSGFHGWAVWPAISLRAYPVMLVKAGLQYSTSPFRFITTTPKGLCSTASASKSSRRLSRCSSLSREVPVSGFMAVVGCLRCTQAFVLRILGSAATQREPVLYSGRDPRSDRFRLPCTTNCFSKSGASPHEIYATRFQINSNRFDAGECWHLCLQPKGSGGFF